MPFDARCPFCSKMYRLKDELSGKKVTCANSSCRKIFQVTPLDADTIAAAALSDELPAVAPAEARTIGMTCVICEHQWTVPGDMQGKNVLCPECKHRQKVPEQKSRSPADWRTGGGGPSLAKRETLEDVVSARDTAMVSGETLRATGIIDDGVEPLPLSVKLQRIGLGIALLAAITMGIVYWVGGKRERISDRFFDDLVQSVDSDDFKAIPHHRAVLRLSFAEYAARRNNPQQLARAIDWFSAALNDLSAAPRRADRDCLIGELALTLLTLGGTDNQIMEQQRLPWTPQVGKNPRAQIRANRAAEEGVLSPLRRVFEAMLANFADFDLRAATTRRLTREILARKVPPAESNDLLLAVLSGFTPAEQPEILAQIGLEFYRAGLKDEAKRRAERLANELTMNPNLATPALAVLGKLTGVPMPSLPAELPSGEDGRWARTVFHLLSGDATKALEEANQPGPEDSRLQALAIAAEWSESPQPVIDAAERIVSEFQARAAPDRSLLAFPLLRLARVAARTDPVKARQFTQAIPDLPLRAFANAEIMHQHWQANPSAAASDSDAPLPADPANPKELLLGHVWGRLHLARHLGTRESANAPALLKDWPRPLVAPYGAIGALLGAQDRMVKP